MEKAMKRLLLAIVFLLLPLAASAADFRPGTDDYLRLKLGMTPEQLSEGIPTEEREPFATMRGEASADDPLGDVLDRAGRTTTLQHPWGDLDGVTVERKEGDGVWEIRAKLGGPLPTKPSDKVALYVYADADGEAVNNAPNEGVRGGMDAEFALQHNQDAGWYTDFRWYNSAENAKAWGIDRETAMRFRISGDTVTLSIPLSEVPAPEPSWRIVMGISDGNRTQIDVAPGEGFPPPKGSAPSAPPTALDRLRAWHEATHPADEVVLAAILLSGGYLLWKRRKKANL